MRSYVFIPVLVLSVGLSWLIWDKSPEYFRQGGPFLILGLTCLLLSFTFGIERYIVLWRAGGRGNAGGFIRKLKESVHTGDIQAAIESCKQQGGCLANTVGAGLERFQKARGNGSDQQKTLEETRKAIEQSSALESPLLEQNLPALSTLASIATLLGLLGTVLGMIRAFHAMSRAGAPDATQLALGISQALLTTAVGLTTAIIATVLYNYFVTRVDAFNNSIDETAFEVMHLLEARLEG